MNGQRRARSTAGLIQMLVAEGLRSEDSYHVVWAGLHRYCELYNSKRRHSSLDRRTPDAVYFNQTASDLAA